MMVMTMKKREIFFSLQCRRTRTCIRTRTRICICIQWVRAASTPPRPPRLAPLPAVHPVQVAEHRVVAAAAAAKQRILPQIRFCHSRLLLLLRRHHRQPLHLSVAEALQVFWKWWQISFDCSLIFRLFFLLRLLLVSEAQF